MRHLTACPSCRRQYDVSGHAVGERIRCVCDEIFVVTQPRSHAARPVRCGSCGGPLENDRLDCPYCRCETTLDERLLSSVCPECFARLAIDGRYCTECGVAISPQCVRPTPEDRSCPRCEGRFQVRAVDQTSVTECGSCGGLWIEPELFEALCRKADHVATLSLATGGKEPRPDRHPFRYLPCVECADLMVPRNYGGTSGVVIDVCGRHGVWLDHRELERVLEWVREGGLDRARERAARAPARKPMSFGAAAAPTAVFGDEDAADWSLRDVLERIASWL